MVEKQFICQFCGMCCRTQTTISKHQNRCIQNPNRIVTPIKRKTWRCKDCGGTFGSKLDYDSHIETTNCVNHFKSNWPKKRAKPDWACKLCSVCCASRKDMYEHIISMHSREERLSCMRNSRRCPYCNYTAKYNSGQTLHERTCFRNPNRVAIKGRPHSEKTKLLMSKKAKERFHKQLLKSGSHTKRLEYQSYPEKFFETAINNNFIDKNYTREHHVGKYWCDFAWIEKQRYIEIDGQQHERNPYQKQHDREKDAFLEGCGWIGLRIPWKNLIYDTHGVIEKAKSFIDNGEVIPDFQRYAYLTNHQKRMLEKYGVSNPGKYGVPFYGRVKKPYEYWKTRLALLDKYDKKSYGWIQKAHIETGLSIPIIRNTCNRFGIQWRTARRANSP